MLQLIEALVCGCIADTRHCSGPVRRCSMGYVKPTSAEDIDPATIEAMARLLGLTVPPLDTSLLSASVRDQLASIQTLEELDLTDVMPALDFDPRWES
jgi:hypothetical protein